MRNQSSSADNQTRRALRTSVLLPVVISFMILLIGAFIFTLVPADQFNNAIAIALGTGMLLFLAFWTRKSNWRLRLIALLFALPALAGIAYGVIQGTAQWMVIGVGLTFLLLVVQRAFSVPTSYRVAARRFQVGDFEQALNLVNKSINARPDFAESYQLRAMIRFAYKQFAKAEEDIRQAIALQPKAHHHYNTLGQIFLAESRYEEAIPVYEQATELDDRVAMHHYHLGLAHYRLGHFRQAAESLSTATRKTLPLSEHNLLAHYLLSRSLRKIKQKKLAATAVEMMHNYADGIDRLEARLAEQAEYEHVIKLRQEAAEIRKLLQKPVKQPTA